MRTILTTLFFLLTSIIQSYSQNNSTDIHIENFPNNGGIIFKQWKDVWLRPGEDIQFHILTKSEIIKAEYIIDSLYKSFLIKAYDKNIDKNKLTQKEKSTWLKTIKKANYFKEFGEYARQYAGFKDGNNSILVTIYLLDFSKEKYRTKYFFDYRNKMIVGFGDFYEKHSRLFVVNIENKTIMRQF